MVYYGIIIQILSFVLYVGYITYKYGTQKSISDSYYLLTKFGGAAFTLFCWGLGVPFLFYGTPFFFLTAAGLVFTGVAADYRIIKYAQEHLIHNTPKKNIRWWVHHISAGIAILSAFLEFWVTHNLYFLLLVFIIITTFFYLFKIKNIVWWVEIVAFVLILTGLFIIV